MTTTSLIVFIRRRPGMTRVEFSTYWRDAHGPLLSACTDFSRHIIRYEQFHASDEADLGAMFGVSGDYDGVAVITFASPQAMTAAFAEPAYLSDVRPDEPNFVDLDNCLSFIANPRRVIG